MQFYNGIMYLMLKPTTDHVASNAENQDCRTMHLITLVGEDR